ncbi:MAG: divalent-cation tolerance protein CutA, partial [Mariprofundaceae bacterium]|nr:divalent-cation tolerance protein CutA [Mariprofundaceae bacterium]
MILTSINDQHQAQNIAQTLVQEKLAACVQISAKGLSIYPWQGEICQDEEYYLCIKTNKQQQQAVFDYLETNHPYDTPEI